MSTNPLWIRVVIIATLLGLACYGQESQERGIWKATPLTYPQIARLAQIQGDVSLQVEVDRTGTIVSVTKIGGPDALAVTASEEIKEWRYTSSAEKWKANVTVHYSLVKPLLPGSPVARVAIRTPFDIGVISNYPLPTGNPETMHPKKQ